MQPDTRIEQTVFGRSCIPLRCKSPGDHGTTRWACTVFDFVLKNIEYIPFDQQFTALVTPRILAFVAGNVAEVNVPQPGLFSQVPHPFQGCDRRGWNVGQFVMGMEPRHMPRCPGSEARLDPCCRVPKFVLVIIVTGDDVRHHFHVHAALLCLYRDFEDPFELRDMPGPHIRPIGKSFDVHPVDIEVRGNHIERLFRDIPVRYIIGTEPPRSSDFCRVEGIFERKCGFVERPGDAEATRVYGLINRLLRREVLGVHPAFFPVGNVPVLASGTSEVASQAPERDPLRAWIVVEDRLFFNGVDRDRRDFAVGQAEEFASFVHSRPAPARLTFRDNALALAGVAPDLVVTKKGI